MGAIVHMHALIKVDLISIGAQSDIQTIAVFEKTFSRQGCVNTSSSNKLRKFSEAGLEIFSQQLKPISFHRQWFLSHIESNELNGWIESWYNIHDYF
jgi:hypothetical protein